MNEFNNISTYLPKGALQKRLKTPLNNPQITEPRYVYTHTGEHSKLSLYGICTD